MHIVPNVLPRSLCGWPRKSLHLLEEGQNCPIVRFAYLHHMIGEKFAFLSSLYFKLFELGVEVAFDNRSAVTYNKSNLLKFLLGAAALSAPMMLLCSSFALASFTSRIPSSLSIDHITRILKYIRSEESHWLRPYLVACPRDDLRRKTLDWSRTVSLDFFDCEVKIALLLLVKK